MQHLFQYDLDQVPGEYYLVKSNKLDEIYYALTQCLIHEKDLISLSRNENEVSLIVEKHAFNAYCSNFNHIGPYRCLLFHTTGCLNESGILAQLTRQFTHYDISILCVSTYAYNYILYPETDHVNFQKMIMENVSNINFTNSPT